MANFNIPGAAWTALLLAVLAAINEWAQALDLAGAPVWASIIVFAIAAIAKAVQEANRPAEGDAAGVVDVTSRSLAPQRRGFLSRLFWG